MASDDRIQLEQSQMEQNEPQRDRPEQLVSSLEPVSERPVDEGKPYSIFGTKARKLIISAAL